MFSYKTNGVCASTINIEIKNNIVESVEFTGGCSGNLQGISHLVKGLSVDDVISRLEGINCGKKSTSCPDQLSKALLQWKSEQK